MQFLKVAAVALNQTPLDWSGNAGRIRKALSQARTEGAGLVCLPELCLTGYGCEDAFFAPGTCEQAWRMLEDLLPETRNLVVAFGLPVTHQRALFNVSAVAVDAKLVGMCAKQNLAGDGIHYEPRWFKPWPVGVADLYQTPDGGVLPIGDLVFDIGGIRLGFEICEDAWVADRPGARLAARAVDVILNPSASHFAFGKAEIRRRFVAEGSRSFGVAYVYSSLLGNEAGRVIYDGQLLIAEKGGVIAESRRFGFQDVRVLSAVIDPRAGRVEKMRIASHRPVLPATADPGVVKVGHDWPVVTPEIEQPDCGMPVETKEDEFTAAVTLGLFDYLRKSHSSGYVVSLSGGADSAAVACLVRLMVDLARSDPGEEAAGKFPSTDFGDIMLTAYQATENSGTITRSAAAVLAEALGATHLDLDLTDIHRAYVDLVSNACGQKLSWEKHDIALQNIQARVRAPGIWMLANLRNALLLTTSNRSEAAVGYATMDGDTAGGLAPISGIDKEFLLQWLRWLETTGPVVNGERRPIPALAVINCQQPTAELRPSGASQTDEDDLMPYPVLDFIERSAIRDHLGPAEIFELLQVRFPAHSRERLCLWTHRFFTLWSRNQWKRERYAPGFHLDDENLDPKTWCRWPILSGGFQDELKTFCCYSQKDLDIYQNLLAESRSRVSPVASAALADRSAGCLLGLATGDALGTTLEFTRPVSFKPMTDMVGGGPFHLEAGQWTDDTSMALCLSASLIECGFDLRDQIERYVRWWKEGYFSSTGSCFDIGNTVSVALRAFMRTGEPVSGSTDPYAAGNGSIMRLAPVPLFFQNADDCIHFSGESSRTTHQAPTAIDACRYLGGILWGLLHGASKADVLVPMYHPSGSVWTNLDPAISEIAMGSFKVKEPPEIRGSGYVVASLEAALWAFHKSESFEEGALLAVNLGEDADTTGAVFGQIAGAFYGKSGIPGRWLEQLHDRELMEEMVQQLIGPDKTNP